MNRVSTIKEIKDLIKDLPDDKKVVLGETNVGGCVNFGSPNDIKYYTISISIEDEQHENY